MKEFVEKLIGRLEEINYCDIQFTVSEVLEKYGFPKESVVQDEIWDELDGLCTIKPVIEIVNQLAEEYNNGWIPCSERLPDDFMSMSYLTTVKGHFYPEVNYYCVANHKWYSNERTTKEVNVIAWMPLPESFKKGE